MKKPFQNLIVNASPIVEKLWRLTRHLFPSSITSLMNFVHKDELPDYIRPEMTPKRLGGTLVDENGSVDS